MMKKASGPDVAIVGLNFPPEPTGIAPYTGSLAAGLQAAGLAVAAHVAHPHYPAWKIQEGFGSWSSAESYRGVAVTRRLHYVPGSPRGVRRLISELSYGVRLAFARLEHPRVVIAVSPSLFATALIALRCRFFARSTRLIVWLQDIYTLGLVETGEGGRFASRVTRWVEVLTLRAAEKVVVIHPRFAEYVVSELGVESSRVAVIRNWTHLPPADEIDALTAREALGWPRNVTLAVHTGNMGKKQGLDNVVEAARLADKQQCSVHFVLIGDGGERHKLEEMARDVDRLCFVAPLDDANYRLALGAADVLVVNEKPGVASMAVPSKLTSYFDAGRPVVAASDPGGITASEVAEAKAGIVVPAGDAAALLAAVLGIGADKEAAAAFGRSGRRFRRAVLDEREAIRGFELLIRECLLHDADD